MWSRSVRAVLGSLLVGACSALTAGGVGAAPVNGDFESGTTSGWNVYWSTNAGGGPLVYAAVIGASTVFPPLSGNYSALISTVSYFPTGSFGTSCANDLFNPTYCPPYPPTGVPSAPVGGPPVSHPVPPYLPPPDRGFGYLAQDIVGSAGQRVEWDWMRHTLADDADSMFYALTDGSHFVLYQSRGQDANYVEGIKVGSGPTLWLAQNFGLAPIQEGQLVHESFVLPNDGVWSLYLGVLQNADAWWSAPIQIDNVRLTSTVREPGTLGLVALGVLLAGSSRRRKRIGV